MSDLASRDPLRHHRAHERLASPFGGGRFGAAAERCARFLGTPRYILGQTVVVAIWIALNVTAIVSHWDPYPFILLNLAFSTQAAYAAPMILLAQTRQADRDRVSELADAQHREDLAAEQTRLLQANTDLTKQVHELTSAVHDTLCKPPSGSADA